MDHRNAIKQYMDDFHKPSDRIKKLGQLLNKDLWRGPITSCVDCGADNLEDCECEVKYPGFSAAVDEVRKVTENWPDLYVGSESEDVFQSEPDDDSEEWYHYERKQVVGIYFGKETADYL